MVHGHAKSSGYFVANSCLLASSLHGCTSPTSGNLSKILTLLTSLCLELGRTGGGGNGDIGSDSGTKVLLMQWIGQLLDTCKPCTAQLNQSDIFQRFLESAVELCTSVSSQAVESVLSALLDLPEITLKVFEFLFSTIRIVVFYLILNYIFLYSDGADSSHLPNMHSPAEESRQCRRITAFTCTLSARHRT